MKQLQRIQELRNIFPLVRGVQLGLLYGSFGRDGTNPNSGIDILVLVEEDFDAGNLIGVLTQKFENDIQYVSKVALNNKLVIYFKSHPKVEFEICKKLEELKSAYLGTEITDVSTTILYSRFDWKGRIEAHLEDIISEKNLTKTLISEEKTINDLIDKFIYEFELCSSIHRRGDGFRFYFFYNKGLHIAAQLYHYAIRESKFHFLPKDFLSKTLRPGEEKDFRALRGSFHLTEANSQKRKLLDFFYKAIQDLISVERQEEIRSFLEWLYKRDFLWNFRDISLLNPRIKNGIVFRTSTLTLMQDESFFEEFLQEKRISTVIDLRADREIETLPYSEKALSNFNYIKAPFDPWNQSIEFQSTHHQGSNIEIAYRFFGIECKESIKQSIEAIVNENNACAIHCHAGKDRTGIFISLLHLLSEADLNVVYNDYLATEMDTRKEYLDIVLDIVNKNGGIVPYLVDCGLHPNQVERLKQKLLNGN